MPETKSSNLDTILGRVVVEMGLTTAEEVRDCLELQRQINAEDEEVARPLADLMVECGLITKRQLDRVRPLAEEEGRGQQIPGYRVKKKLGAGAMATVYMARQLSLDRIVAIKVLPRKHTNNPQFVERFYAEGKAAAKLNHPNIVQAIDVGQAGEYHYFVMEYVEGHTVGDDIGRLERYEEPDALSIVIQVAEALRHAHGQGFIHRDVKPKNIMITPSGVAKLADMGLARAEWDREAAEAEQGKAYGTPYYISPEQIRGEVDIDFRADLYGLGATFYHMVTGKVPFDGANPSAVMHQHLKADLVPPDHLNPTLTAGISEIIEVCMAKKKDKRYNSSADLLEDLNAVATGEAPVQARRKFDFESFAALEPSDSDTYAAAKRPEPAAPPQPLIWIAVIGWTLAVAMLVILFMNLAQ